MHCLRSLLKTRCRLRPACPIGADYDLTDEYTLREVFRLFRSAVANTITYIFSKRSEKVFHSEDVTFYWSNPTSSDLRQIAIGDNSSAINLKIPICILVHGWNDHKDRRWVKELVRGKANIYKEHLKFVNGNICVVDWSRPANFEYRLSRQFTTDVATQIAHLIRWLVDLGAKLNNFTLIGHSLGAHIVGFTGAEFQGNIGRIIALDPAGPLFTIPRDVGPARRLNPSNARNVQVIHTAGGTYGVLMPCGHVDFYPNGGVSPQPGCHVQALSGKGMAGYLFRSHIRAVTYFRYSLNPENKFVARPCESYTSWKNGSCSKNEPIDRLGYLSTEKGVYYLNTSDTPPFALGIQ